MVFLVSPVKSIFLETKAINKMTDPAAQFDHRNRRAYLKCFIDRFIKLDSELADPGRFPKGRNFILIIDNSMSLTFPPHDPSDSRDGNGFWVPFRVYGVHGEFQCPQDDSCSWKSKELQVDVLVSSL